MLDTLTPYGMEEKKKALYELQRNMGMGIHQGGIGQGLCNSLGPPPPPTRISESLYITLERLAGLAHTTSSMVDQIMGPRPCEGGAQTPAPSNLQDLLSRISDTISAIDNNLAMISARL